MKKLFVLFLLPFSVAASDLVDIQPDGKPSFASRFYPCEKGIQEYKVRMQQWAFIYSDGHENSATEVEKLKPRGECRRYAGSAPASSAPRGMIMVPAQ